MVDELQQALLHLQIPIAVEQVHTVRGYLVIVLPSRCVLVGELQIAP